jgi:hypothetical protein
VEYELARRTPRYSLVIDVELTDVQSGIQIKARTKQLSLFGCGVDALRLFPKGTNVRIRLFHSGADVNALARVVYANPELGMGMAFTKVDRENERILDWWITELTSIPTPRP